MTDETQFDVLKRYRAHGVDVPLHFEVTRLYSSPVTTDTCRGVTEVLPYQRRRLQVYSDSTVRSPLSVCFYVTTSSGLSTVTRPLSFHLELSRPFFDTPYGIEL